MARPRAPKALEQAREARNELYKKLIVDAAEQEFAELGFEAARIQKVAEAAALSVGTIYGVFAGKVELYNAVHEARGSELIKRVYAATAAHKDAVAAIEHGIDSYVHFYVEHPLYLRMQLREGTAWAMSQKESPQKHSAVLDQNWRAGLEMVAAVCQRGIKQGVFLERDAMRMAKTLTAIHQVQLADWVEKGMGEQPSEVITRLTQSFRKLYCSEKRARR